MSLVCNLFIKILLVLVYYSLLLRRWILRCRLINFFKSYSTRLSILYISGLLSRDDETYLILEARSLICSNSFREGGAPTKGIKSSHKNEEASLVVLLSS